MPNRILREGILTSERVNSLNWQAEVFYRRLMSVVDDFGRYYAHASLLRAALYPLKLDTVRDADIERLLTTVEQARLIRMYEVDGKRYLMLLDFRQQARAKDSKFPQPLEDDSYMRSTCIADDDHVDSSSISDAPVFGGGDVFGDEGDSNGENSVPLQEPIATNNCPHQQIIDLYHEILPSARRVREWNASRQAALRARWREDRKRQDLDWWRKFFEYITRCDFLMGRVSTPGRAPFEIDIDFILTPKRFIKIIEGGYENREVPA